MIACVTFKNPSTGGSWTTEFRRFNGEGHLRNFVSYMAVKRGLVYDEHRELDYHFELGEFLFKVLDVTHVRMFKSDGGEVGWGWHIAQLADRPWGEELRYLTKQYAK